jgi:carboxyl-terminal processing protease
VYKEYLSALILSKDSFLNRILKNFQYETKIDDAIKTKDLAFFDLTYNRLMQRMEESKEYLKVGFR